MAYHNRSSSNCLYSSIRLINYLISLGGLLVNNSHSSESSDNPIRKVLVAIFSLPSLIIVQFPVSVSVAAKGFPSPYFHLKQRVHRLWNSTAGHEPDTKLLNQLNFFELIQEFGVWFSTAGHEPDTKLLNQLKKIVN